MLTGRLPEGGVTPGRLNPDLDGGWDALLGRLLAPDPDARPPGAEAALAELEAVYEAWRARREAACALPADGPAAAGAPAAVRLRAVPRRVPPAKAAAAFGLDGLRRPLRYHAGRFEDRGDGTVADRAAGLLWERGGSPHPLTWEEAGERVRRLGEAGLAGRRDWRLPTLEELMSLLTPVPRGRGHCIEPVFDTRHRWLWSADRASASAAWYANVEVGFVDNQDTGCYNFCRAVASLEEGP
nr:DUF1566 domain-containing protein [Dissulfurirhabdus thermomarina]